MRRKFSNCYFKSTKSFFVSEFSTHYFYSIGLAFSYFLMIGFMCLIRVFLVGGKLKYMFKYLTGSAWISLMLGTRFSW